MSMPRERKQGSFLEVSVWSGDLFKLGDRYRVFREKALPRLRVAREELSGLYCEGNGRPAIEPVVMAGAVLLQFMERAPDRQAAEHVRLHLGWKYALDVEMDYGGFHPTSLGVFRQRLVEGGRERLLFDTVLEGLQEEGLVRKRSKQRLDSTHVLGYVSQMNRLEVVRETIRLFLQDMETLGLEELPEGWEGLQERYCDSEVDYRKVTSEKLKERFAQAGADGLRLLGWMERQSEELRSREKSQLLRRVVTEQFEVVEGAAEPREKEAAGVVKNPHDPDAQWSAKDTAKKTAWVGYKAQVMETVAEEGKREEGAPTGQFITEITTTEAIASDFEGMDRVLEVMQEREEERPAELYVDAGYVSGETLAQAQEEGYELVGPARPEPNHKTLPVSSFKVDIANRTAECPAGKASTACNLINDAHQGQSYHRFEWGEQCEGCPLQQQCTKSKTGRRTVAVGIHYDLVQRRRREMHTEGFQERVKQRNAIEGTISELVRGYGMRRTRYRSLVKTRLANYCIGAACNVRRWIRLLAWEMQGAEARG